MIIIGKISKFLTKFAKNYRIWKQTILKRKDVAGL